jgi:quercetin dioxygenase-like cupin family protein
MAVRNHPSGVWLLKMGDSEVEELGPGLFVERPLTDIGLDALGGGYVTTAPDGGELAGWTLHYDGVLFVHRGRLDVFRGDEQTTAGPGEAIAIRKGENVTYRGSGELFAFFALTPANWVDQEDSEESRRVREAPKVPRG